MSDKKETNPIAMALGAVLVIAVAGAVLQPFLEIIRVYQNTLWSLAALAGLIMWVVNKP